MNDLSSTPALSILGLLAALLAKAPLGADDTAPAAPVTATTPMARTVAGETFAAKLVKVDADWTITFKGASPERTLRAAQLVAWSNPAEVRRSPQIFTSDGSLLIGDVAITADEHLLVRTDLLGTVRLPLERVRGVLFQPPAGRARRDRLAARIRRAQGDTDRIILVNGDELAGAVLGLEDLQVRLETDVGITKIDVSKIAALVFDPTLLAPDEARGLRALVGLGDGTLMVATSLTVSDDGARAKLPGGVEIALDAAEDIVSLQPLGGRATYLSDITAARFRHVPYLDLAWPYHRDRNVLGARLRAGKRLYNKGLGMHSAARLTYRLTKPYRRFEAEVAIDESAGRQGSVVFRVFTSDGQSWQAAFTSGVVRGGAEPLPVAVDLTGVKAIALVVDFADRGDQQDHADWLDARLIE